MPPRDNASTPHDANSRTQQDSDAAGLYNRAGLRAGDAPTTAGAGGVPPQRQVSGNASSQTPDSDAQTEQLWQTMRTLPQTLHGLDEPNSTAGPIATEPPAAACQAPAPERHRPSFQPPGGHAAGQQPQPQPPQFNAGPQPAADDDTRLLEEASRIAGSVRHRFEELERREKQLVEQLSAFDQEQRRFRLIQQQCHDELEVQNSELKRREQEFAERLDKGQRLLSQLQHREQALEQTTAQLDAARSRLRGEVGQEIEVERAALKHSKGLVDAERKELAAQAERMRDEHQKTMRQIRRDLEVERRRLKQQLTVETEAERKEFERQVTEWKAGRETHNAAVQRVEEDLAGRRAADEEELAAARKTFDQQKSTAEAELKAEREELREKRVELERLAIDSEADLAERRQLLEAEARKAREAALVELRRSWEEERSRLARELAGNIDTRKKQLAKEVAEFEEHRDREMTSLEEIRTTQEAALRQARSDLVEQKRQAEEQRTREFEAHRTQLATARGQFEAELKQRLAGREEQLARNVAEFEEQKRKQQLAIEQASGALAAERSDIENEQAEWRQQLATEQKQQEDVRRNVHSLQHALDVRRQQFRTESTGRQQTLERRLGQLGRFREVLQQREESLAREREALTLSRVQFAAECDADREKLAEELAAVERQREEAETVLDRERQELERDRRKLQERTECLDELRKELEQVSVRNLESRLAAEEALAELTGEIGSDSAEQRVTEVRSVIAGQIQELQGVSGESSTARMAAITQRQIEEESSQLNEERTAFTRRMNQREQELHEQESRLQTRLTEWEQRESRWRHMRDDWLKEKLNAEQIIRNLLDELSEARAAA